MNSWSTTHWKSEKTKKYWVWSWCCPWHTAFRFRRCRPFSWKLLVHSQRSSSNYQWWLSMKNLCHFKNKIGCWLSSQIWCLSGEEGTNSCCWKLSRHLQRDDLERESWPNFNQVRFLIFAVQTLKVFDYMCDIWEEYVRMIWEVFMNLPEETSLKSDKVEDCDPSKKERKKLCNV